MTLKNTFTVPALIVLASVLLIMWSFFNLRPAFGEAPLGTAAAFATSSTVVVGPGNMVNVFAANTNCTNRVISTVAQPIMLMYATSSGNATSTGTIGTIQAASTTTGYSSGLYGCSYVGAYSFVASTTITISEFR